MFKYDPKLKKYSRELRTNMTREERKLWYEFLCCMPVRFRRQRPVGEYILDFYCVSKKVAIELDGSQHYEDKWVEYDKKRDEYLKGLGIKVLRYSNHDVNKYFDAVCEDIMYRLGLLDDMLPEE